MQLETLRRPAKMLSFLEKGISLNSAKKAPPQLIILSSLSQKATLASVV